MLIYIILILIVIAYLFIKKTDRNLKIYLGFVTLTMILIVGLRDISVGKVDTEYIYTPRIMKYFQYTYQQLWNFQTKDKIFYVVTKFLSNIYENINFVLFVIGIPFIMSIIHLIRKYSHNVCMSIICFLGLQYFTMSFFLLRQVIAMAFCIYAFDALVENKKTKFVIFVILGSLFHQTCLVFLLAYPLSKLEKGIKQWCVVIGAFLISLFAEQLVRLSIFKTLNILLGESTRYSNYEFSESGLGYTGFIIQLCVFLCVSYIYYGKKNLVDNKEANRVFVIKFRRLSTKKQMEMRNSVILEEQSRIMYNLATISLIFMAFSSIIGEFWRVSSYFGIYNIILLPNAISTIKNRKTRVQINLLIGIIMVLYFLFIHLDNAQALPYKFFWN